MKLSGWPKRIRDGESRQGFDPGLGAAGDVAAMNGGMGTSIISRRTVFRSARLQQRRTYA
jgi:hypothetical protein